MEEMRFEPKPPYEQLAPLPETADEASQVTEQAWQEEWSGDQLKRFSTLQKTPLIKAPRAGVLPGMVVELAKIPAAQSFEFPLVPFSRYN